MACYRVNFTFTFTTHQQIVWVLISHLFLQRTTCLLNKFVLTVNKCFFVVSHNTVAGVTLSNINPLNAELNPICHLLALLGAHHILHVSGIRVKFVFLSISVCLLSCSSCCTSLLVSRLGHVEHSFLYIFEAIPLQAWTGPEGSRRLRLQGFKTIGT